jgi:hypothetical protein
MDSFARADLFFLITAAVVLGIGFITAVLLLYLFILIRDVQFIIKRIRGSVEKISEDLDSAREGAKTWGSKVFVSVLERFAGKGREKKKKTNT